MKIENIIKSLEMIAPTDYAENWDNVGLLVGTRDRDAKKIMVALDAIDTVIEQAVEQKVDLLITHHPMIFSSMKRINDEDFIGRRVLKLVENKISYYAMHTNCDVCVMNEEAARKLSIKAEDVLEVVKVNEEGTSMGIGTVGTLPEMMEVGELAQRVKKVFLAKNVRITGELTKKVQRIAVSTGAGKSMIAAALAKKAQVLVTGDIDHHAAIDALAQGLQIIDAGHYGTEHFMVEYIANYIRGKYGDEIKVLEALEEDPFSEI